MPPGPPGPIPAVRLTVVVAEASALDETTIRAVHVPPGLPAFGVTVNVAGVVPLMGETVKKLVQVASEIATENGDAPAVLSTLIVCPNAPGCPPGPCGPPPPKVSRDNADGLVTRLGDVATVRLTGNVRGLFDAPAAEIAIEP